MRYENLRVDVVDVDFIDFSDGGLVGNVVLYGTDELIEITNSIRKEQGCTDLVEVECNNDVYYNFYLVFDMTKREVGIQAVCNYGEKDDEAIYKLPMTTEEERNVLFKLAECLADTLYNS